MSTATPVTDLDEVEEGTELAVMVGDGKIERWEWRDGVMAKDDHVLPPFFFSGLLADGKVMPGNFSPPVKGEWFTRPNSEWAYLVVKDKGDQMFRCGYFRRDNFYDWRDVSQRDLIDMCTRADAPEWSTPQFLRMADLCSNENESRTESDRKIRTIRDARSNVRYARDYLNAAIDTMDRERQ